ncbi:MAG: glycine cleavage system aminomethyltransferase GcvT [Vicinamibacterales bacterium]|nr:glycine cleavage system aminomethyltransferase GcvT [Vicinamibacterales bacterium]
MTDAAQTLKQTPLHGRHQALGARMVPFGGWEMPIEYGGLASEHMAVRTAAGLFDVSHMGEIEVAGRDALAAIQRISCNDASKLEVGQAQYSGLTTPRGTLVDDVLVYRLADDHFMLVVNAANIAKDYRWIAQEIEPAGDVVAVNASSRYALLAVQGPAAVETVQPITGVELSDVAYYRFAAGEVAGKLATISRTGYTGEDGLEIYVAPQAADAVWKALTESGAPLGLVPAGLGARDTLRLEAAMRLYGNDMDEETTVLEAGLGWMVGWDKAEFIGHAALRQQKADGVGRRLAGFEMVDRGIARPGYPVRVDGEVVGKVTSGTQTPFVKKSIGMAYLPAARAKADTEFEVEIRGRWARAKVVRMPFYRRQGG